MTARLTVSMLLTSLLLTSACTVHRLDIRQGNYLTAEDVGQLTEGMTREQVRFLLGTPMVANSFRRDRWDYLYYLDSRYVEDERTHIAIWFEDERIARIETYDAPVR